MALINYLARIRFDFGAIALLGEELAALGVRRPLIVTDAGIAASPILERAKAALAPGMTAALFTGTPMNPTETAVKAALAQYQGEGCDGVVALGGGSPIDLMKAVALLASQGGALDEYLVTKGGMARIKPLAVPTLAIPTTAGSGAEVGRASVVILETGRKSVLGSLFLIPKTVICDPELVLGLPAWLTAATGMDAITHCVETYLSPTVNPPAAALGMDALARAAAWIERSTADGSNRQGRWEMMMAALMAGMTFQKGLGAVHALTMPLGELGLHHGQANAILLPAVLRYNADHVGTKSDDLRRVLGLPANADLARWVADLNARLGIPSGLGALNLDRAQIPAMAALALPDNASRTNPRPPSQEGYEEILRQSW
ncbi:MAG: iron-containing alcohol dehydrogenase [Rhodospirillales bacterium]|nr:iron-containing alcohol dehydrogenase [Rhodospirillales bacterium]